jgi:hypothetical protein
MAADSIPAWQCLVGLALLAGAAYGMVLVAARCFRVENLLSNRTFSWRRLLGEFASRVHPEIT